MEDYSVTLIASQAGTRTQNYDFYDAYLDTQGFLLYGGQGAERQTDVIPLQLPQTDTRNNENEMPSALGRRFSQTSWSHGSGQLRFHEGDREQFNYSEGFDVSEIGILKHLRATALNPMGALTAGSSGRTAQTANALFLADGTNVKNFANATLAPATENPHAGDPAVTVQDITAEGDQLFVALGTNGIHLRNAAGVYSHWNDVPAIRVAILKERLIACDARNFYEVVTSGAAPAAKLTLKTGWTFTAIAELGEHIYAAAIHEASGQTRIHRFGLDSSLTVVWQGSTEFPENELIYSLRSNLGVLIISGGRKNASGGKDTIAYRATEQEDGALTYSLIADSEGAGTRDLASRFATTFGRKVLIGWTLGADSPFDQREGLAVYDLALDSFTHHLASSLTTTTPDPVLGISVFAGRIVFSTIDGLYYERTDAYVSQAFLITSTATFGHAGLKNWDLSEITHKELPSTSSVQLQFSTIEPDANEWEIAGTNAVPDSTEETFRHPNVDTPEFTLKIVSNASSAQASAPEIKSFSVRSTPTLEEPEYRLTRTFRVFDQDRGSSNMQAVLQNPVTVRDWLRTKINQRLDYYESDTPQGYSVRLVGMSEISPVPPPTDFDGNPYDEGFIVRVQMEGTTNAP